MLPGMDLMSCPNLAVSAEVMQHVVRVESSYNPFAIGVVGGRLVRQPENLPEALATVRMLESGGFNFSLGLAQVNRYNLGKYGLDSYEKAFEACPNLQAGSRILSECHNRSGGDWGKAFSCYYSGNFVTGYRHGYVQKIYASMGMNPSSPTSRTSGPAIAVVSRASRRSVQVARYPVYATRQTSAGRVIAESVMPRRPLPSSTPGESMLSEALAGDNAITNSAPLAQVANVPAPASGALQPIADEAFVF